MYNSTYKVYDLKGNEIFEGKRKEIIERFGLNKNTSFKTYTENEMVLKGKYRIKKCGETVVKAGNRKPSAYFTKQMLKEWRYMNKKYGKKENS